MSRSPTTLYVGTNVEQKVKPVRFELDDVRLLTLDFSAYCGIEGTLINSATWTVIDNSEQVTVGTVTTGTKTTECLITAADTGIAVIQVTTSFDNDEVLIHLFRCEVIDPEQAIGTLRDNYA